MLKLVRALHKLSGLPAYQKKVSADLPETARLDPHHDSVMMGYDFHLTEAGPKLIEVNTNAGGYWLAQLCENPSVGHFSKNAVQCLIRSFLNEFFLFQGGQKRLPSFLAIVDDNPKSQFLYPEMQAFLALFREAGIACAIVDPTEFHLQGNILYLVGQRVELIYNRHCDFYLQTPAMASIKKAWLARTVCLTPNPHSYGLLADKRRMILWSNSEQLKTIGLRLPERDLLGTMIPSTCLLASMAQNHAWQSRKQWVFKPDTGYASQGVYVGNKLTAAKFGQFDPAHTLMQSWVPPSTNRFPGEPPFKTDFRLFAYQNRLLCVSARLYRGQVTNLRTPHGGFAKVIVTPDA